MERGRGKKQVPLRLRPPTKYSPMKTRATICASLGLALGLAMMAGAAQVTFQVDMSAQTALGSFDPASDTVLVSGGAINNWSTTASPLASTAADTNIWAGTFDVPGTAGATVQYKFIMKTAAGVVWEGTVGTGGTTGNRTFILSAGGQTLPVVYFNNVTNSTSVTDLITFRVNMSVQIAMGNFDPSFGTLTLAGEFNAWGTSANPMTNSVTDPNIWVTTLSLSGAVGSPVDFKYVMNGTWEGNVGAGGTANRALTLERTNQTLPVVYFNNLTSVPVPTPLLFQVNMGVQAALGNFDPASDFVEAQGSFNNWTGGFTLTNSPDSPNIYSGTWVDSTDIPGNAIQYQFVLDGSTWETSVGNRNYTITSTNAQTLPLVFFNGVDNLGPISMQPISGRQAVLSWTAGPLISLQTGASLLNAPWQDVANTRGSNTVTVTIGPGLQFFRLTGP